MPAKPNFTYSPAPALAPQPGVPWADTMLLNPAIVREPGTKTLHMLFRTTGPYPEKRVEGSPFDPYPIFLGYAKSGDLGKTWEADFSRPALAPALDYTYEGLFIKDDQGNTVVNYSNGCIEDPRIFEVEGQLYVTAACRLFAPGPYWLKHPGMTDTNTNLPAWAKEKDNPLGEIAYKCDTVTVLFKLDLDKLTARDYDNAFTYVCPLTDGTVTDNRDVFLFPEKMKIGGKMQYVMIHRPEKPEVFTAGKGAKKPSIMLAAAEDIRDFITEKAAHKLLAVSEFDWEDEKVGASWPPIRLNEKEWLLPYHGKQMPDYGYTQSFMILENREDDFPKVTHRCSERLMYAQQKWELPDKFPCPCMFTTGGIVVDGTLIMSYGAADQYAGISWVNFNDLVEYVRGFDKNGEKI